MTVEWRGEMSVGNEVIDDDHKHLIDLINEYESAIARKNPVILEDAVNGLLDYAKSHFEREENLMTAVHYPQRNLHRDHHRDLLRRVQDFHKGLCEDHQIDIEDASRFLHDWFVQHVLNEDLKLRPYLTGERHDAK